MRVLAFVRQTFDEVEHADVTAEPMGRSSGQVGHTRTEAISLTNLLKAQPPVWVSSRGVPR